MAAGDVTIFNTISEQIGEEVHDFENDTFKLALITNGVTPSAADATPQWGAGSGVDYDGNEVSSAGNYTANGETLTSVTFDRSVGVCTFDAANVSIAQHGSGFTNAYWGIIYNDTATNKDCLCFVDLDGAVSEQAGPVAINWNASGIFTCTVNA